jgi:DNA-binding MarR family transcriptional regulator
MIAEPDDDEATLSRGFMLWQITNGWQRAVRSALAPIGLTYVQVVLLAGLEDRAVEGGKVSQASLAQALGTDVMMTSQVLRALETSGHVRRDRDPDDTRARVLALTDLGRKTLAEAKPLLRTVDDDFFQALGRKEERFTKGMRKLWKKRRSLGMANIDKARPPPPPPPPPPAPAPKKARRWAWPISTNPTRPPYHHPNRRPRRRSSASPRRNRRHASGRGSVITALRFRKTRAQHVVDPGLPTIAASAERLDDVAVEP